MARIIVPKEIFVGLQVRQTRGNQTSADGESNVALGFATYLNNKGLLQHKDTFNKWRDTSIPRFPYDNDPIVGMSVRGSVDRYRSHNKLVRIEDPRGFQLEIPIENFIEVIYECTLKNGVIKDEMVWGWDNGQVRLYKVGGENYNQGIANFKYDGQKNIPMKTINLGDTILLDNGDTGVYYGGWHIVTDHFGWNDYAANIKIKKVSSKRVFFVKVDKEHATFYTYSSLKVKNVTPINEPLNKGDIFNQFTSEINKTVNYNYKRSLAHIEAKKENYQWHDPRYKTLYNKYGLNDEGNNLIGVEGCMSWRDGFSDISAISDKPIKDEIIYNEKIIF